MGTKSRDALTVSLVWFVVNADIVVSCERSAKEHDGPGKGVCCVGGVEVLVHVEVDVHCSRRQFLHPRNIFCQRLHVAHWLFGLAVPLALDGGHINGHKSRSFFVGCQDLIIWITRPCVGLLCERDGHACKHIERARSPS